MGIKLPHQTSGHSRLLPLSLITSAALAVAVGASPAIRASAAPDIRFLAPRGMSIHVAQTGGGVAHPLDLGVNALNVSGTPLVTTSSPTGYTPAQITAYLGLSGTGTGQTIAIVDAYHDPYIASDLAKFDSTFGLPAPPSFKQVNQTGSTSSYPAVDAGWALEISLDVEWAHAIAPGANILLVEASTSSFANMDTAISYAAKQTAVTVISNSWGAGEFNGESTLDSYCKQTAKVCVVSAGDNGNPGLYPAFSPYAVAVGGTSLQLSSEGTSVISESAWSGSGGGISVYESRPSYQSGVNSSSKRGETDVSFDADPATGFSVYDSVSYGGQTGWFQMGGTSAGAPQWAAIIAVADAERKAAGKSVFTATTSHGGFPMHSALYSITSGLADITTGSNGSCGTVCNATAGYDFVTGRGSPRAGIDIALKNA